MGAGVGMAAVVAEAGRRASVGASVGSSGSGEFDFGAKANLVQDAPGAASFAAAPTPRFSFAICALM